MTFSTSTNGYLALMIDEQDNSASLDLVLEVGEYFGLRANDMNVTAGEVAKAVAASREEAARIGISKSEVERMSSAFEHDDLEAALAL